MKTHRSAPTMGRLASRAAVFMALGVGAAALLLAGCVHTQAFRDADGRIVPGSVATMERATIGGVAQALWFRGRSTANPALVLLHGGPGVSESALFRRYAAGLEEHFLVVYWEQRGAGRSFDPGIARESMTLRTFVRDLDEVVELVRRRFGHHKVVLVAHSWGTAFGTIYAAEHPDKVAAYVGIGQVADMTEGERLSYEYALGQAESRGDARAAASLRAIGPPPHGVDEMLVSRRFVERFGGSFHADLSTGKLVWAALSTDEAGVLDLVAFGRGNRFSLGALWPEFSRLRLDPDYRVVPVPVFFLLGRHDRQVPAELAARYFERIEAPYKRLVWFERSAHHPPFEEPDRFVRTLVEAVRPHALPGR